MSKGLRLFVGAIFLVAAVAIGMMAMQGDDAGEVKYRTVTDSTGAEVQIPEHPQRVVILNASNVDMYYGAGGTVVGRPTTTSYDPELAKKLDGVAEVGNIHSPNIEAILNLNPDLVIGVNVPFHTNLRETLAQAGIPLIINKLDAYEDVLTTLTFYGELTGNEKAAAEEKERIVSAHDEVVAKAKQHTPPKSLVVFGAPNSFNMATSQSFCGSLLAELGGGNIADTADGVDGAFVPLSMEYIAKANPEVIFFISMSPNPTIADSFKQQMQDSSVWQGVDAVKNGRIYYLSGNLFTVNPGTKIGQSLEILYKDLYEGGTDGGAK